MARTETQVVEGKTVQEITWLRSLEEKVHAAADRLRTLREENAALRAQVENLEERLAAATAATGGDAGGWAEEREEIRGRVERLVEHLEALEDL